MKDLTELEKKLGVEFEDKELLKQSLTHRSYLNENPDFDLNHNERLEFLGDAVLELAVTEDLFKEYSEPEGELTNWRSALVNSEMLARVSEKLEIEDYLLLSRGEKKDRGRGRRYILGNALEAVIGAIYLDKGYKVVKKFVEENFLTHLPRILEEGLYKDAKSLFQEEAQDRLNITPTYEALSEEGPDHNKKFTVGVCLDDELVAKGGGFSKQAAQEEAARKALERKNWS